MRRALPLSAGHGIAGTMTGRVIALFVLFLAFQTTPLRADRSPPLVLAASSLQESLTAAADTWARKGHVRPVISFAASSALARQIDAGAPADMFLSADQEWMDFLASRGRIRVASRTILATNRLVLIAPASSRQRIAIVPGFPLAAALGKGRLAMADPSAVPAGRYGQQALESLRIWPSVAGRLARAENVRAAMALVARSAAPLGIVYATDAQAEPRVKVLAVFPQSSHDRIVYPLALVSRSSSREAEGFRQFLLSGEAKAIFRRYGFGVR